MRIRHGRYGCMNNNYLNNSTSCMNKDVIEKSCNNISNETEYNQNCSCGFDDEESNVFPEYPSLAQSYVPIQTMTETFKPCNGLKNGTIFPELVSPYSPGDSMKEINYLKCTNPIREGCNSCQ